MPWAEGDALHSLLQIIFPIGSFPTHMYPWHQPCENELHSHGGVHLQLLISTSRPSGSNPAAPSLRQKNLKAMYSKYARKMNQYAGIMMGFALFFSLPFPRNSVFDKLYFNAIQH